MGKKKNNKKNKNLENRGLAHVFLCRENLMRDILIVAFGIGLLVLTLKNYCISWFKDNYYRPESTEIIDVKIENPSINTEDWQDYANKWYGFELKYPKNWLKPVQKNPTGEDKWEYRYEFREKEEDESNPYLGFDVAVYNVSKVKELFNTTEFPTFKYEMNENEICRYISGQMNGEESYPAEEIYIPPNDKCHNPAFLFSLTRDEYIYNIFLVRKEDRETPLNPKKDAAQYFPEFFSVASSFSLINIVRAKPKPVVRISAPMPVSAVVSNGRLVCAKKNDQPGKSKQNKGKHLDMECCLDPDEYPNPHCYYSPSKYGKYL